uniref:Ig-like domain-containing protein n=1 Tax=Hucho hucho TaxID=62062 RepID=A0A4W5QEZ4_9TELE
ALPLLLYEGLYGVSYLFSPLAIWQTGYSLGSLFYLTPKVLHVFKDGNEEYDHQDPVYKNRTTIKMDQLASGNLSLLLNPVNVRDNRMTCDVILIINGETSKVCQITVNVAASYQKPKLTLDVTDMTLVCTTHGGFPEDQVTWRTHNRTLEPQEAVNKPTKDPRTGTYSISSRVNVTAGQNITCSVYNPILNETQSTSTIIPACEFYHPVNVQRHLATICLFVILLIAVILCLKRESHSFHCEFTYSSKLALCNSIRIKVVLCIVKVGILFCYCRPQLQEAMLSTTRS